MWNAELYMKDSIDCKTFNCIIFNLSIHKINLMYSRRRCKEVSKSSDHSESDVDITSQFSSEETSLSSSLVAKKSRKYVKSSSSDSDRESSESEVSSENEDSSES